MVHSWTTYVVGMTSTSNILSTEIRLELKRHHKATLSSCHQVIWRECMIFFLPLDGISPSPAKDASRLHLADLINNLRVCIYSFPRSLWPQVGTSKDMWGMKCCYVLWIMIWNLPNKQNKTKNFNDLLCTISKCIDIYRHHIIIQLEYYTLNQKSKFLSDTFWYNSRNI